MCREVVQRFWQRSSLQDEALREALVEAQLVNRKKDVIFLVDTRVFTDPGRGANRRHCGTHDDILNGFVYHRKFNRFLHVLASIHTYIATRYNPNSEYVLAFYCKSGRHRSVAASTIAAHLSECTPDLPSPTNTFHACARYWYMLCGGSQQCARCHEQNHARNAALARARQAWSQLFAS